MFFLNTGAYILKRKEKKNLILKLLSLKLIGDVLVKGLDFFKKLFLFGAGITKHERITPIIKQAYYAPHPTWSSRTPVLAFPRQIPTKPNHKLADFFEILENGLILSYREKPVEIMLGMKDVAWSPRVLEEEWTRILPNAVIKKVEDAGHFIQEDAYEIIVPELLQFLKKLNG